LPKTKAEIFSTPLEGQQDLPFDNGQVPAAAAAPADAGDLVVGPGDGDRPPVAGPPEAGRPPRSHKKQKKTDAPEATTPRPAAEPGGNGPVPASVKTDDLMTELDDIGATPGHSIGARDLRELRISQDFGEDLGLEQPPSPVQVTKPEPEWFFRVHPDPAYRSRFLLLETKEDKDKDKKKKGGNFRGVIYLITRNLQEDVMAEPSLYPRLATIKLLVTAITRQKVIFLWPLRLPEEGETSKWTLSAWEAAREAQTKWVRVTSNMSHSTNIITPAAPRVQLKEPAFPQRDFLDLVNAGFRGRIIDSWDHPVLKRLMEGEE
jgi:hypothetical protein